MQALFFCLFSGATPVRAAFFSIRSNQTCSERHPYIPYFTGSARDFIVRLRPLSEEVYLKQHDSVQSLLMGLTDYFVFYNEERCHQSWATKHPAWSTKQLQEAVQRLWINLAALGRHHPPFRYASRGIMSPEQKDWDSTIQQEYKQGSILNSVNICLDRVGHFKTFISRSTIG